MGFRAALAHPWPVQARLVQARPCPGQALSRPGQACGRADSRKVWTCWFLHPPLILHTPKIAFPPLRGIIYTSRPHRADDREFLYIFPGPWGSLGVPGEVPRVPWGTLGCPLDLPGRSLGCFGDAHGSPRGPMVPIRRKTLIFLSILKGWS